MKKIFSYFSVFYILLWIAVWGGGYMSFLSFINNEWVRNISSQSNYAIAEIGNISESIEVVWSAELVDEQQMKFTKTGKVTKVNVKEWESVQNWQVLAELDNSQALIAIEQQKINVENAKIKLQQLYEWVDESKKLEALKNIENQKKSIEIAKKELEILQVNHQIALDSAQKNIEFKKEDILQIQKSLQDEEQNLEQTKKEQQNNLATTEIETQNTLQSLVLDYKKDLNTVQESIESIDYILGYTEANKSKNDEYEIYLSAKNLSHLTEAKKYLWLAIIDYNSAKNPDYSDLENLLVLQKWMFENLFLAVDATYNVLENTVESTALSQSQIDSKKSQMSSLRSKIQSSQTSILNYDKKLQTLSNVELLQWSQSLSLEKINNSLKNYQTSLDKAQNDLSILEKNLEQLHKNQAIEFQQKENSIKNYEESIIIAQKSYEELIKWPTDANISSAKNDIKKAELSLDDAQKELENYKLIAPFSGIVRTLDIKVWDNLVSDNSKYIYLENPNLVVIPVQLDQVDIVKVEVGQNAKITFDAYPTQVINGKISLIDYTPSQSNGVVTYTIKLIIDDDMFDKKILSWMTADIEIVTLSKENVLLLDSQAITTKNDISYITLQNNSQIEILTGLVSNGKTEIISWIQSWERVILPSFVSSSSQTSSNGTSLINIWWNTSRNSGNRNFWWNSFAPPGWF